MTRSLLLLAAALVTPAPAAARTCSWQGSWMSAQMTPDANNALPAGALNDATLRQIVRLSTGGNRVRVRVSNAFGRTPLAIGAATIARSPGNDTARVAPDSLRRVTFGGAAGVTVPPGGEWLSDPVTIAAPSFGDVAVSLHVRSEPDGQTAHAGSRATSYVVAGDRSGATDLTGATPTDHWFLLSGVEVERCAPATAILAFGDSITDGYGVKPNRNERWTDFLSRRLGGRTAVLNAGIGGNRLLLDGTGANALARLDRDVLGQAGVTHLIVLEGINDIGMLTRDRPAGAAEHRALVAGITGAYAQIVARARAHGVKVIGATVLPFMANRYYHPDAASEADRQAVNDWIRAPGHFDGVIDFDRAMRDPARPAYLLAAYDSGDGLHPGIAGYRAMAEAVPLALLQ